MNGYLMFLKSLSQYQQRAEIARLAFQARWAQDPSLEEYILKIPAVLRFSKALGVNPLSWELDLKHYAEEPDLFGPPVFRGDQCTATLRFRYEHLNHNLLITGIIYIEDDRSAKISTLTCLSDEEKSQSRKRLVLAGINPDTLEKVSYNLEMSRNIPYLDCLQALMPQQRREAIFELTELAWGTDNPKFLDHPKLASESQKLGISELGQSDRVFQVGPVEFDGERCTAPLTYYLYGEGELSRCFGYYVEVHILARIGNKPSGGGDISIENIWFRIDSIDDPPENEDLLLVENLLLFPNLVARYHQ